MKLSIDPSGQTVSFDDKAVLAGFHISIYQADGELREGSESLAPVEPSVVGGTDGAGSYTGVFRSFAHQETGSAGAADELGSASIELRVYQDFFAVKAVCDLEGALNPGGHFRIEIDELPGMQQLLALHMFGDPWSRPHFNPDLSQLPQRTQMLLWKTGDGVYGCLVPLVHGGFKCQLNGRTGKLGADLIYFDTGHNRSEGFALVGGFGTDPFELVSRCVAGGMAVTNRPGKLRWEKPYPGVFDGIGWCTWNSLYQNVNEADVLKKMEHFKQAGFPVKYVLIDDGWSAVNGALLSGFGADPAKFPRGLKPLFDDLRSLYGVADTGVWHTFTGYWGGIDADSDIYKAYRSDILDTKGNAHIPYPQAPRSFAFWNTWHSLLRDQGVSFVKVDNQCATFQHSQGMIPVGLAAKGQQYGLQASVGLNFNQAVINCMCMLNENIWHWVSSNIARNSDDFMPGNIESACEHARQNVYNNLFYHNFAWPDWDMFWSYHQHADYHGAMRAISGGPVYFTDEVDKGDYSKLWPLILSDGTVLRCDGPALPTRDCLFLDPQTQPKALKAFNTAAGAGMLIALNATDGEPTVPGEIRPEDVDGLAGELFAVREFFSKETRLLKLGGSWGFDIEPYGVKLFAVVPVKDQVAVVGLANKYVSGAAVVSSSTSAAGVHVVLAEGGELVAYSERPLKRVFAADSEVPFTQKDGWVAATVPGQEQADVWLEFAKR